MFFFFSSRRRHTRSKRDWSSDVCSSDLPDPRTRSSESEGPEKFPNVITVLERRYPNAAWARFLHRFEAVVFSTFIALILCVTRSEEGRVGKECRSRSSGQHE